MLNKSLKKNLGATEISNDYYEEPILSLHLTSLKVNARMINSIPYETVTTC